MTREQFTDQQLVELVERRSPHHQKMIDRAMLQAFLDGRLVLKSDEVQAAEGKIFETAEFVERLIKAGFHKVTDNGRGMKASAYRKMWPRTVVQPPAYAGRFDEVLLVDRTIALSALAELGNFYLAVKPEECKNLVPAPVGKDGQPVSRYIAFVQLGKKNLGRTVTDCRKTFAPDEIGLVTREGLHLPVEHEAHLRQYAVDLAGSACVETRAPYVNWFTSAKPSFSARDARNSSSRYGSASRGSEVIALP